MPAAAAWRSIQPIDFLPLLSFVVGGDRHYALRARIKHDFHQVWLTGMKPGEPLRAVT